MDRKEEILNIAQKLAQEKGLNGFSYIDISRKIGIKTSSIHYYFKTKDNLALALIRRYHKNFEMQLKHMDAQNLKPLEKLIRFADIFKNLAFTRKKFCLCGMMAAEAAALSKEGCRELTLYFQMCTQWLANIFSILKSPNPIVDAKAYLSLMEGALLISRVENQDQTIMLQEVSKIFIENTLNRIKRRKNG